MNAFVEGVRDILPAELRKRRAIYKSIREVFEANAFREVITPTLESLELYAGIEGLVDKSEMFKVVDENGQILVLRPDFWPRLIVTTRDQLSALWLTTLAPMTW